MPDPRRAGRRPIQRSELPATFTPEALRDVRGVFFALVVSVAVIVAGVAPLVEADPDPRAPGAVALITSG